MNGIKLILAVLLVAINAFFVVAEYALVRSRRARLELMSEEGSGGARLALSQLDRINEYISAVQIGVTMTSIGIGALAEPALAHLLEQAFGNGIGRDLSIVIAVALAFVVITSTQLVAGEMVPKLYAIDRAEPIARRIARPLEAFSRAFRPVIVGLTAVSVRILKLIGADVQGGEEAGSPDELKRLIAESYAGGHLDQGEAGMLTGVFQLHEQEARQVMTPIPAVVTVDISQDVETALRLCISSGHTRLVVIEEGNRDHVRGLVHASALARRLMEDGVGSSIEPIVHDAPIVPETKPLDDLLADLRRQRTSMAVVVDEYGRVVGIVTVEDIIEEVVGEIADETDAAAGEVRRLSNGDWLVRGHVSIGDLLDYGVQLPVDSDAYNSVGGFVFAELGRLARRGDTISSGRFSLRVESVAHNRIETVRIRERRPVPTRQTADEPREAPPAG